MSSYKKLYLEEKEKVEMIAQRLTEFNILSLLFLHKLGGNIEITVPEMQEFLQDGSPLLFYELDETVEPAVLKYRLPTADETAKYKESIDKHE